MPVITIITIIATITIMNGVFHRLAKNRSSKPRPMAIATQPDSRRIRNDSYFAVPLQTPLQLPFGHLASMCMFAATEQTSHAKPT